MSRFSAAKDKFMRQKQMTAEEKVLSEMTVLERQIADRAGQWVLRNGKYWDEGLRAYVHKCANCKHLFLAQRSDKKTCSEACKKAQQRKGGVGEKQPKDQPQMSFAQLERLLKRHQAAITG